MHTGVLTTTNKWTAKKAIIDQPKVKTLVPKPDDVPNKVFTTRSIGVT